MTRSIARPAGRLALTLAAAGIATMGSLAYAPAASAAPVQTGPSTIVDGPGHGGPDAFIVKDKGRLPVFFCDADKPNKHANKCITLVEDGGTRF